MEELHVFIEIQARFDLSMFIFKPGKPSIVDLLSAMVLHLCSEPGTCVERAQQGHSGCLDFEGIDL